MFNNKRKREKVEKKVSITNKPNKKRNISKNIKEKNYRYGILTFLTYIIGIVLLANLFKIQVIDGKDYREKATSRLVKEVKVDPVRGNIKVKKVIKS